MMGVTMTNDRFHLNKHQREAVRYLREILNEDQLLFLAVSFKNTYIIVFSSFFIYAMSAEQIAKISLYLNKLRESSTPITARISPMNAR